jgi:hypothetical protein
MQFGIVAQPAGSRIRAGIKAQKDTGAVFAAMRFEDIPLQVFEEGAIKVSLRVDLGAPEVIDWHEQLSSVVKVIYIETV